ncbi:MAG: EVE domain-containing protein [Coriobacteriia bacterium]|nr:EVE domain-containing protein [Coriobacteriia bacterium]
MLPQYWLAITRRKDLLDTETRDSWWCLPQRANVGDRVLLYCPRSVSPKFQGVFAEAEVDVDTRSQKPGGSPCSGYVSDLNEGLAYMEIRVIRRFDSALTAQRMKNDPLLAEMRAVRRNFQGTIFTLDVNTYERMQFLLSQPGE